MKHDLFISHASEDKADLVRPLVHELASLGLRVWYDEDMIRGGDSIRESIDRGLRDTRNAIVVLSPAFLSKRWTKWELGALVQRFNQMNPRRQGRLIPIWHHISQNEVRKFSPSLADIAAFQSTNGIDTIALKIRDLIIPRSQIPKKSGYLVGVDGQVIEACADAFLRFLRAALNSENITISIYLLDSDRKVLSPAYPSAARGARSFSISAKPRRNGFTALVAKQDVLVQVTSRPPSKDIYNDFLKREEFRAMIAVPIVTSVGTKPVGVFNISSSEKGLFEREEYYLMKNFVPMVSSVFQAILVSSGGKKAREEFARMRITEWSRSRS